MEQIKSPKYTDSLKELFIETFKESFAEVSNIGGDGSNRKIIKISGAKNTAVGVYGPDKLENNAFVSFSEHFAGFSLPVPKIYAYKEQEKIYIESYLGESTLFDILNRERKDDIFPQSVIDYYKKSLFFLSEFQTKAVENFNFKICYPRAAFDEQSMRWDLNYFKYYFIKLAGIAFNEQKLEDDFNALVKILLSAKSEFFLYRDFQSRNIMIKDGETFFIDYQGGRRGALQYDVASLLYDAKADMPPELRLELAQYYCALSQIKKVSSKEEFFNFYYAFVYIRLMQAMGAYGLRGFYEKKAHFLQSVPYVIKNLEWLLANAVLPEKLPELTRVFKRIVSSTYLRNFGSKRLGLTLKIFSFSYKNGMPQDFSGHNGGFVFDCRCLPNPGREEQYKKLTGKDKSVIEYLEKSEEVSAFFKNAYALVEMAISNYQTRNFTDLSVCFGCTGGQHRSVYMAEKLAASFKGKKDVKVELSHREISKQ